MKIMLLITTTFMSLLTITTSLSCHQCSTVTDPGCADPYTGQANMTLCPTVTDREYTLCRKISQKVRGKVDVFRRCGWVEDERECYTTKLDEYNSMVCQCKEDMCNAADQGMLGFEMLILMMWAFYCF